MERKTQVMKEERKAQVVSKTTKSSHESTLSGLELLSLELELKALAFISNSLEQILILRVASVEGIEYLC
jgi:hypothetical protein